jgi:hypothetical protein
MVGGEPGAPVMGLTPAVCLANTARTPTAGDGSALPSGNFLFQSVHLPWFAYSSPEHVPHGTDLVDFHYCLGRERRKMHILDMVGGQLEEGGIGDDKIPFEFPYQSGEHTEVIIKC